jgi:hypothetical protein
VAPEVRPRLTARRVGSRRPRARDSRTHRCVLAPPPHTHMRIQRRHNRE